MNDSQLNELLRQSREEAELPPSFQREVWQKIAAVKAREEARWGWIRPLLDWFTRPLAAAAAWALALMAGLLLGNLKAQSPTSEARAAAYAHFINPLAKFPAR